MARQQKQVTVLARYAHKTDGKLNGTVTYLVKSSDGKSQYCTTLIDGKASGCSCPARSKCYHKTQLEQKESERKVVATQFAAKSVPVWAVELVKDGTLVAPKQVVSKPAQEIVSPSVGNSHVAKVHNKVTDIGERGNFGSKAFSLMKEAV